MTFTRTHYAMAASVAALAIAAPAVFYSMHGGFKPMSYDAPQDVASGLTRKDTPVEIATLEEKSRPVPTEAGAKTVNEKKPETTAPQRAEELAPAKPPSEPASQPVAPLPAEPAPVFAQELAPSSPPIGPSQGQAIDHVGRSQLGLAEADHRPTDGLGAVAGPDRRLPYLREEEKLARSADDAKAKEAQNMGRLVAGAEPPQAAGKPASPASINAAAGQRMKGDLNKTAILDGTIRPAGDMPAYNPYAHMDEAERQRTIAEQEFRDKFEAKEQSPIKQVAAEPVSTFSTDVDTASYSFVRRALNSGRLPPKDSVRVEEMINYFPYSYPKPATADVPFQPTVTVVPSPWNSSNQLVHIGIKGYDLSSEDRPRANLVFLIDVSGSMESQDKLPLVKNAFRMLVEELRPDDTVGIVTYASGSGVLLEPTKISDKRRILTAIDRLGAGGSTAGAEGIQDAYRLAEENFDKSAVNRVILATDGDFNVGVTNQDELKGLIERKRGNGIFLSILGVGQGNYNDSLMQTLAQNGNGTAAYVDTLNEARKVLVDEASSTLFTIAKDVKVQIEWNPQRVSEYRLIGYETRALKREDFNNDRVDAGDIGSGHTVTAIYEVTPAGAPPMVDDLRYGKKTASTERAATIVEDDGKNAELGFLKLRYKLPKEEASKLVTLPVTWAVGEKKAQPAYDEAQFSIAVAAFGQLLKGSPYLKGYTYDDVLSLAGPARGPDPFGYRAEFLNLVRLAKSARE